MTQDRSHIVSRTMAAAYQLGLAKAELMEIASFAETYQRWLDRLVASAKASDHHLSKNTAAKAAASFAAKICALVCDVDPTTSANWSLDLLKVRAGELQLYVPIQEGVQLSFQMKWNGGYRPVLSFGWRRRVAQRICSDILRCLYPLQPFDFMAKGRGAAAALLHLRHLIEKENSQYVVVADIKDCFGSPNKEQLAKLLRLPSRVVNNSILIGDEVTITPHPSAMEIPTISIADYVKENGAARRGIPQGSSASPVVMYRAVLGPLLATLSFSSRLVSCGDDIAVPAKDLKTAEAYLKTLTSVLLTSPVGPLAIGRHKITTLAQGADYLGYRISRKPQFYGGHIHLRPSPRSFARLEQGAMARFLNAGKGDSGAQEVQTYVGHWMSAFGLWAPNQTSKELIGLSLAALGIPTPSPSTPVQSA